MDYLNTTACHGNYELGGEISDIVGSWLSTLNSMGWISHDELFQQSGGEAAIDALPASSISCSTVPGLLPNQPTSTTRAADPIKSQRDNKRTGQNREA
jgi:hypothetical protein